EGVVDVGGGSSKLLEHAVEPSTAERTGVKAAQTELADTFLGVVDVSQLDAVASKSGRHDKLVEDEDERKMQAMFARNERQEKLEEMLSKQQSRRVTLCRCTQEGCPNRGVDYLRQADICRSKGHRIATRDGRQYFFACGSCGQRETTLTGNAPSERC